MENSLKMYVFEEVLTDYTHGMMVVIAESWEEAVDICIEKMGYGEMLRKRPKDKSWYWQRNINEIKESAFHVLPLEKGSFAQCYGGG